MASRMDHLLGAFVKLQEVTVSFVTSVCLSSHLIEQLSSHWTDFQEILYLSIFQKSVIKFKFFIKIWSE